MSAYDQGEIAMKRFKNVLRVAVVAVIACAVAACVPHFPSNASLNVTPTGSGATISWPGAAVDGAGKTIVRYRIDVDGAQVASIDSPARSCLLSGLTGGSHSVGVTAYDSGGEWSGSDSGGTVTGQVVPPNPAVAGSTMRCDGVAPPTTDRIYMTDHVGLSDVQAGTDQVAVSSRMSVGGCSDYDSCPNGVRETGGYVWFQALALNVGPSLGNPTSYGMHGGLAFGGSGNQSEMYLDWSGYCPSSLGGQALRDGGSDCANPNNNPTYKPHTVLHLDTSHWYDLTVRKVACSVSDVTDISGPLTGWEMVLVDQSTGTQQSGGTWCLPNAPVIEQASLFNEVIELRGGGPCATDYQSAEWKDPKFHTTAGWTAFAHATGHYNGNETPIDADCPNVNLRLVGPNDIMDRRGEPRGANGGLTGPGWQSFY